MNLLDSCRCHRLLKAVLSKKVQNRKKMEKLVPAAHDIRMQRVGTGLADFRVRLEKPLGNANVGGKFFQKKKISDGILKKWARSAVSQAHAPG